MIPHGIFDLHLSQTVRDVEHLFMCLLAIYIRGMMLVRNQLYCCLCVGILMMNVSLPTLIWLVQFPYRRQELWLTLWITYGIGVQANMLKWYPQIILGRFSFHLPNFLIGPNYFKITQMQENVPSEVLLFFFFFPSPTLAGYISQGKWNGQCAGMRNESLSLTSHQ